MARTTGKKGMKKDKAANQAFTHARRGFIVLHVNTLRDSSELIAKHVFSRFTPYAREFNPYNPELIAFRGICPDFDQIRMDSREIPQYTVKYDQQTTPGGVRTEVKFVRIGKEIPASAPTEKKGIRKK